MNFNYDQVEITLSQNVLSLGVFALTINIGTIISTVAIVYLITLKKTLKSVLSLLNLLVIVFSSALVMVAIYSHENAYYLDIPIWMNYMALAAGIVVVLAGFLGYYASLKNDQFLLKLYAYFLLAIIVFMIVAAAGYVFISMTIDEIVDTDWPNIYGNLLATGANTTKKIFIDYLKMNLKFAGIYGFMYVFFLVITFLATLNKISIIS